MRITVLRGILRSIPGPAWAVSLGLIAFLACFDHRILHVRDLGWVSRGDIATNFLGWHFFRYEDWSWPPGLLANYAQGLGASIALTDSIALVAFALKPIQSLLPPAFNYLGLWIALCFALQGYFGYRLLQSLGLSVARAAAGALLLCVMPFMLARATLHVPLASHWLLLASIYLYVESLRSPRRFRHWSLLLPASILVNAYLFTAVAAIFVASAAAALLWPGDAVARRSAALHSALAATLAIAALHAVGFFGVDITPTWGAYGQLQMNLLAWFNPQGLGVLLPNIRLAESGQTDAYMYLGAGGIAVLVIGTLRLVLARPRLDARFVPLGLAALALLALAVTHRVAAGPHFLFELPLAHFAQEKLNAFRSSGRLAWLPTYLAMVVAIVGCARLGRRTFAAIMVAAIALNLYDARPIRAMGRSLVAQAGHRGLPRCDVLPASAERVVFVPRVTLDDYSIAEGFDLALCAAMQRQAINVGYLARVNLARADAASRDAAAWLEREPSPLLAYAYRNPAVATALGASADTPKIGGFHVFAPRRADTRADSVAPSIPLNSAWTWPLEIGMGTGERGPDVQLTGWAPPMKGMVWSFRSRVELLLPVATDSATDARIHLVAYPSPLGGRDLNLTVMVNGVELPGLEVLASHGLALYPVTVPAAVIAQARGMLRLEFSLPETPPFDPPRGYPNDRPRLLVTRLRAAATGAQTATGRVAAMSPGATALEFGWSAPESWGTWSVARRATLRVPLPEKRQGSVRLRVLAHANGPEGKQEVRVVIQGQAIARWTYVALAKEEWHEAVIPAELLPAKGEQLQVVFEIEKPARPAIPGNLDMRMLGIGLVEYQLLGS